MDFLGFDGQRGPSRDFSVCNRSTSCCESRRMGSVTCNAPDGAGTQLRYSPLTAACSRLR